MRRLILIPLALCILAGSLLFSSGNAHAQTRADLAPRQIAIAADSGYTYSFYGGSWGWGFCLSHDTLQGFADGSAYPRQLVYGFIAVKVGDWPGYIAFAGLDGISWWLQHVVDRGRGICVGFVWGSLAAGWIWPQ